MVTRIISALSKFTTSAQAGTRVPGLQVLDGDGAQIMLLSSFQSHAAAGSRFVSYVHGAVSQFTGAAGFDLVEVPDLLLPAGYSIKSLTEGIQTEDQYGAIPLWIEEFEEEPDHPLAHLVAEVCEIIERRKAAGYAAS